MASSGKKKTTMAKLTRESRVRERRLEKKARKDRRKQAAENPGATGPTLIDGQPVLDGAAADGVAAVEPESRLPNRTSDPVTGRAS